MFFKGLHRLLSKCAFRGSKLGTADYTQLFAEMCRGEDGLYGIGLCNVLVEDTSFDHVVIFAAFLLLLNPMAYLSTARSVSSTAM